MPNEFTLPDNLIAANRHPGTPLPLPCEIIL